MSFNLMRKIWSMQLPTTEKFILMALADRANDDGGDCFPSQAELAYKTGLTPRSVKNAIARLKNRQLVEIKKHRKNRNSYQLLVRNFSALMGNDVPLNGERDSPSVGKEIPHNGETDSPLMGNDVPLNGERDSPPLQLQPNNQSVDPIRELETAPALPPGAEDYVTMTFPPDITQLAIRLAEVRRSESGAKRVEHRAIDYYSELIKEIFVEGNYDEAAIDRVVRWFEHTPEGREQWRFGMSDLVNSHIHIVGRTDKRLKQHVFLRNLAGLVTKANDWESGRSRTSSVPRGVKAYHARVMKHDPSAVELLSPDEIEDDEVPY